MLALLLAPINTYHSALTLLSLKAYDQLLSRQPLSTRMSIGHAVVASILRRNTRVGTVNEVDGILVICKDLVTGTPGDDRSATLQLQPPSPEEQGWLARMIHLFASDDASTQLEVSVRARYTVQQRFI